MSTHTFKVSDQSMNSHGYKIVTDGIDTINFEKNPVMYYMHNRDFNSYRTLGEPTQGK